MSYQPIHDNTYETGTLITAKARPGVNLRIEKYYQRIYYCSVVGETSGKLLVYFDRELVDPKSDLKS